MELVFFGSGAFGLPTLERLAGEHEVALVVTQPARPAGRSRTPTPTPVGAFAATHGLPVIEPERLDPAAVETIRAIRADAFVVIAYGHKLSEALLDGVFAVNLHASLLPKYRGAAPIHWAVINGETETGVSVIGLAQRMDAGLVYARVATPIDPAETTGELHDRLAELGAPPVLETLARAAAGDRTADAQDETLATAAPKLSKADGTVRFDQPAAAVRCRVHGLTPWPGCTVLLDGHRLKLGRVEVVDVADEDAAAAPPGGDAPGLVAADLTVACAPGRIRVLLVQPAGGRPMPFDAFCRGHDAGPGMTMEAT